MLKTERSVLISFMTCVLTGLTPSCGVGHLDPAHQEALPGGRAEPPGGLCQKSGGHWHLNLRSCSCAQDQLFSTQRGCLNAVPTAQLHSSVQVSCSDHAVCAELPTHAALTAQLLQGIPVDLPHPKLEAYLVLQPWSARATDWELQQVTLRPSHDMMVRYNAAVLLGEGLAPQAAARACEGLLELQAPDMQAPSQRLCANLGRALESVRQDLEPIDLHAKSSGQGPAAIAFAVGNLGEAAGHAIYNLVGRGGTYFTRTLELSHGRHLILEVVLSPQGQVMGGTLRRHLPLPHSAEFLLQVDTVHFDHLFVPLQEETRQAGPRRALQEAVRTGLQRSREGWPPHRLSTDGGQLPLWQPLRAMVLESAVDPRVPGLWQRMDVRSHEAARWTQGSRLERPLFSWPADPVEAALQITADLAGSHGTLVAALLAADLPGVKISLMTGGHGEWAANAEGAADLLMEKLRIDAPQVVNISRNYDITLANCEAVFGPVLARSSQSILFVAAAGNGDTRNAAHVCPASLAPYYPNLIAVAGVNPDGSIGHDPKSREPTSNYGDTVQIAAPVCAQAEIYSETGLSLHRDCGTSMAAPVVANAALRVVARRPDLHPADLRQLLMDTCTPSGQDVECGGQLDVEGLEAWLWQNPAPRWHPAARPARRPGNTRRF